MSVADPNDRTADHENNALESVRDPVCGMTVDPTTPHRAEHAGQRYFFCGAKCRGRFVAQPARYLSDDQAGHAAAAPAGAGTRWTCPMHPEIVRDAPGSCPICGMALEPRLVSVDEVQNPELAQMTRRFWVGVALTIPILVVAMADFVPGLSALMQFASPRAWQWLEFILATPVVSW